MHRRDFIKQSAALLAVSGLPSYIGQLADMKKRVGLIGSGWYGKTDLLRLMQVAPVEVVSLCDVDSKMLADAADLVATRQLSKKQPRTYADYREMLKETRSRHRAHRHARSLARAADDRGRQVRRRRLGAEADQRRRRRRPGDAGRGAQVQTRRAGRHAAPQHAAPHRRATTGSSSEGKLGNIGLVEIYCYYHMRATQNPPDSAPPANLDYEMWTGPAPMRPYNSLVHPRSWRAFMEYGNGIVGDMCVHMLDMVRWMLDLGWPTRVSSSGGILVDKKSKANITDTQTATFDYPQPQGGLDASLLGRCARSEVSVGGDLLRRQGHAQGRASIATTSRPARRARRRCTRTSSSSSNSFPRTRPRRISNGTSRRPFAAT